MSDETNDLSRRTFLKGTGLAATTLATGGSATAVTGTSPPAFPIDYANVRVQEAQKAWKRGYRGRPDRTIGLTDTGTDARHPDVGPWNGVSIESTEDGYELRNVSFNGETTAGQELSYSGVIEPGVTGAEGTTELQPFTTGSDEDLVVATASWDQGQSANDLDFRLIEVGSGATVASSESFQGPETIRAVVSPDTDYRLELYTFASGPTTYEISGQVMKAGIAIEDYSGSPADDVGTEVTPSTPKCLGWFGAEEQPLDDNGHGTHVASIMGGSGRASEIDDETVQAEEPNAVLAAGEFLEYEVAAEAGTGVFGSAYGAAIELAIEGPNGQTLDRTDFHEGDATPIDDRGVFGTNLVVETPTVHDGGTEIYTVYVWPKSGEAAAVGRAERVCVGAFETPDSTTGDRTSGDGVTLHSGVAPNSGLVGFEGLSDAAAFVGDNASQLAADFGLRAVNMSWGTVGGLPTGAAAGVADATVSDVKNITSGGVLVCAAAGNSTTPANSSSPALADEAISVVATDPLDGITDYSSGGVAAVDEDDGGVYGKPDVTAPGGGSTDLVNAAKTGDPSVPASDQRIRDYVEKGGTSMASPYVNGVAGLVAEAMEFDAPEAIALPEPAETTAADVMRLKAILLATASETAFTAAPHHKAHVPTYEFGGRDPYEGYGRINPDAAVDAVSRELLDAAGLSAGASDSASFSEVLGLDVPLDSRAVAGYVDIPEGTLEASVSFERYEGSESGRATDSPHLDLFVYDAATPASNGEPTIVAKAQGLQGDASVSLDVGESGGTYVVAAKLVDVPGAYTGTDVRAHVDLGVEFTAAELPAVAVTGSRADDGRAFTAGQTDHVSVAVDSLDERVREVVVYDEIPGSWTVVSDDAHPVSESKAGYSPPAGRKLVELGRVASFELRDDRPKTFDYFADVGDETGRHVLGAARAEVVSGDEGLGSAAATFGGMDTNVVVGASTNVD